MLLYYVYEKIVGNFTHTGLLEMLQNKPFAFQNKSPKKAE